MKIKNLLILLLSIVSFSAYAQSGGIKGKVLERTTRDVVGAVQVTLMPGNLTVSTNSDGTFSFDLVEKGEYSLMFESPEYEALTIAVRVEDSVRELSSVIIIPEEQIFVDDTIFAEFDSETLEDASSLPSSLSASKDLFSSVASYEFSEMRFDVRGYDSRYSDVYLNGIRFNDAMTGYTPWSLWSGLNDATRNQEITSNMTVGDVGVGGIGGTTNINTLPSAMRQGLRVSLVNGNAMYRFRAMVTYSSGLQDNGWAYAFSLSTRQGGNSYVDGVYYNTFGYFAAIEKQFNSRHRLSLMFLGAPTERGAQQASTQEAYDLVGSNYYNPNWGWQDGEMRNTRVRENHEPIAMLNYRFDINDRAQLDIATSFRFGQNGYSALTWQYGPDPRPDYYRYLPSFYADRNSPEAPWAYEWWKNNTNNIRHFNFDNMYNNNYNGYQDERYGAGHRSNYMIEERHTDQLDWNGNARFTYLIDNDSKFIAGVNARANRTQYYTEVKDLMGGDYWVDVDKFAERDFGSSLWSSQNNMDYFEQYGIAPVAKEGDKFGYNYYAKLISGSAWAMYTVKTGRLESTLAGELGYTSFWRTGLWRKGLFPTDSKGDSAAQDYLTYKIKANLNYNIATGHDLEMNAVYMEEAPEFRSAFVSPRTRNRATPGITTEQITSVDLTYNMRIGDLKARVSGYFTDINDQSKVLSYYDDVASSFTNFAMSNIDTRHFGLEAAVSVPLYRGLAFEGAVSWGQYTYDNNPNYVQIQDNSDKDIASGKVYWEDFRVEGAPQFATNVGLSYRGERSIYASIDLNYYDNNYLSMSPLYRTDRVLTPSMSAEEISYMRGQEKFDAAYTLNASIGKTWYINYNYMLGVNLQVKNILNNQSIKTGGYEQTRLSKQMDSSVTDYQPFDSKYFYMFGTTYYLNVYFRF